MNKVGINKVMKVTIGGTVYLTQHAIDKMSELYRYRRFLGLRCPWCGAWFGQKKCCSFEIDEENDTVSIKRK